MREITKIVTNKLIFWHGTVVVSTTGFPKRLLSQLFTNEHGVGELLWLIKLFHLLCLEYTLMPSVHDTALCRLLVRGQQAKMYQKHCDNYSTY